jgi:hypothetical protein
MPAPRMSTAGTIPRPVLRQMATTVAQALLSLLLALALVMLVRRIGGAFVQPLCGLAMVAAAAGLAIVVALVRLLVIGWFARALHSEPSTQYSVRSASHQDGVAARSTSIAFAIPGIAGIVLLAAFTLSGTPAVAIAFAWFLVVAGEGASWLLTYRPELLNRHRWQQISAIRETTEEIAAEVEAEVPAGLVQQLTRVREGDRESIHALLMAKIPPGDRLAAIHVAFCPPLEVAPELTAHAIDADDAEVRITQAETFGARIEVRVREVASEQHSVLVEVLGSATCR